MLVAQTVSLGEVGFRPPETPTYGFEDIREVLWVVDAVGAAAVLAPVVENSKTGKNDLSLATYGSNIYVNPPVGHPDRVRVDDVRRLHSKLWAGIDSFAERDSPLAEPLDPAESLNLMSVLRWIKVEAHFRGLVGKENPSLYPSPAVYAGALTVLRSISDAERVGKIAGNNVLTPQRERQQRRAIAELPSTVLSCKLDSWGRNRQLATVVTTSRLESDL